jgi:hypothetical protein
MLENRTYEEHQKFAKTETTITYRCNLIRQYQSFIFVGDFVHKLLISHLLG